MTNLSLTIAVLVPRLRAHHTRLAFLLRMWHISSSALYDDASFARPASARLTQARAWW
jgi:hypothetical protein